MQDIICHIFDVVDIQIYATLQQDLSLTANSFEISKYFGRKNFVSLHITHRFRKNAYIPVPTMTFLLQEKQRIVSTQQPLKHCSNDASLFIFDTLE